MVALLIGVFFAIDEIVYSIVKTLYTIFLALGEVRLSADETTGAILSRIYVLIFFIMVFVLAYVLLNYIINPDKLNDSNIGAQSLLRKILISLGVVIISPMLFSELYYVQHLVIKSHVIENIILGGHTFKYEDGTEVDDDSISVNYVIAAVYTSFLYPEDGSAWDCLQDGINGEEQEEDSALGGYCNAYYQTISTGSISGFSRYIRKDGFKYHWIISPIAGIALIFFILSFCVNLGMRVFKLLVLEILAPIPAMLELVPGKSGSLKRYFETTMGVFAELFIYQAVVLGGMWLVSMVPVVIPDLFTNLPNNIGIFAYMILIFAMLKVAKDLPKLITDVLGVKSGGVLKATGLRALGMAGTTAGIGYGLKHAFTDKGNGGIGNRLLAAGQAVGHGLYANRNSESLTGSYNNFKKYNDQVQRSAASRQMRAYNNKQDRADFKQWKEKNHYKWYNPISSRMGYHDQNKTMSNTEFKDAKRTLEVNKRVTDAKKALEAATYGKDETYLQLKSARSLFEKTATKNENGQYIDSAGRVVGDDALMVTLNNGNKMTYSELKQKMNEIELDSVKKNPEAANEYFSTISSIAAANQDVYQSPEGVSLSARSYRDSDGKIKAEEVLESVKTIDDAAKATQESINNNEGYMNKRFAEMQKEKNDAAAKEAASANSANNK